MAALLRILEKYGIVCSLPPPDWQQEGGDLDGDTYQFCRVNSGGRDFLLRLQVD